MKKYISLAMGLVLTLSMLFIFVVPASAEVTDTFVDEIPDDSANFKSEVVEFSSVGDDPANRHKIDVENNPDLGRTLLMKVAAPRNAKWTEYIVYKMDKNVCGFKFDVVCCAGLGNPLEDITVFLSQNGTDWAEVSTQATKYVYDEDIYINFEKAYWHNSTLTNKEKIDTGYKYIKIQFNGCTEAHDVPWNIAIDTITVYMGSNEPAPTISAEDKFETYEQIYHKNNHDYVGVVTNPTCTEQGYTTYTCSTCGESYIGDDIAPLGHAYDNDCDSTCNRCTETRDIQHTYTDNCDRECNLCFATRIAPHNYSGICDDECNTCEFLRKVTHNYSAATCINPKTCSICGATEGEALGHNYADETCTAPKTCKACGDTVGEKLGHTYSNACDKSCNRCKATRSVSGHSYEKVLTKATTTKDGKIKNVCSECGYTASKVTTLYKASKVSLSKTSYTYNGKVQKPSVVVKDSKGKTISSKHYTVTYASGRKNVGKYKVTVKFKGNYSGTKTLYFTINPVKTTLGTLTAAKKALTVKWTKKAPQISGYQIQYSTTKSFKSYKTKTVSSYKTTSTKLTGLSAKKTYYVRVRTYKAVNGKKYYSGWSTIKYKKTK